MSEGSPAEGGDEAEDFRDARAARATTAEWLTVANDESSMLNVFFTPTAMRGLKDAFHRIHNDDGDDEGKGAAELRPKSVSELKSLVENILREDPRSVYRKAKCSEMLYFSQVSGVHVTSWFDDDNRIVNVLKIV